MGFSRNNRVLLSMQSTSPTQTPSRESYTIRPAITPTLHIPTGALSLPQWIVLKYILSTRVYQKMTTKPMTSPESF